MARLISFFSLFTCLTIIGNVNVSAQNIPEDKVLNNYIEYLITTTRATEVNFKLVIENANYLLQVSHFTFSDNFKTRIPELAIDKSSFMSKRVEEMSDLRAKYDNNNTELKNLQVPTSILEIMQEYIAVSNTLIFKMNENASAYAMLSKSQHTLIETHWASKVTDGTDPNLATKIIPDLKSLSPELWESEQSSINNEITRQYELYMKLVGMIEKMEGVSYNKTFNIANQKAIREDSEKAENEELVKKKEELSDFKVSTLFKKQYRVYPFFQGFSSFETLKQNCEVLGEYSIDLISKGFELKAIEKMKTMCGQFNENTSSEVLNKLVAYYITDLKHNYDGDPKVLIWIPKDENAYLENEHPIFNDEEGIILIWTRLVHISGKLNSPLNEKDPLVMGKYFRNEENRTTASFAYDSEFMKITLMDEILEYLNTLDGNSTAFDTVLESLVKNPVCPPCIDDYYGYNGISYNENKRKKWEDKCHSLVDRGLIAYKILQINRWNSTKATNVFFDFYWVPGDENQSVDEKIRPTTSEGYLFVIEGHNDGHMLKELRRSYD
jgi:hypothetical protein